MKHETGHHPQPVGDTQKVGKVRRRAGLRFDQGVNGKSTQASLTDGILRITVPKKTGATKTQTEVKIDDGS